MARDKASRTRRRRTQVAPAEAVVPVQPAPPAPRSDQAEARGHRMTDTPYAQGNAFELAADPADQSYTRSMPANVPRTSLHAPVPPARSSSLQAPAVPPRTSSLQPEASASSSASALQSEPLQPAAVRRPVDQSVAGGLGMAASQTLGLAAGSNGLAQAPPTSRKRTKQDNLDMFADRHGQMSAGADVGAGIAELQRENPLHNPLDPGSQPTQSIYGTEAAENVAQGSSMFGGVFGLGGDLASAASLVMDGKKGFKQDKFGTTMTAGSTLASATKNSAQLALAAGAQGAASVVPVASIVKDSADLIISGKGAYDAGKSRGKLDELAAQYGGAISDEDQRSAFLSSLDQQKKTGKKMRVGRSRSPMAREQLEGLTAEQRKAHAAEFLAYQSHKNRNRNALNATSSGLMVAGAATTLGAGPAGAAVGGGLTLAGASVKGAGALTRSMKGRATKAGRARRQGKESERLYWADQFHKSHQAQKAGGEASPYAEALEAFGISTEHMDDMTAEDLYKKLLTQ